MKYRPEIDGLRALAILPVIFYHAGFRIFSGGFVGVDIFFVISGFLITSIILKDLSVGGFSFANFYIRRARRILPPLFVMILIVVPFAFFWLNTHQYLSFTKSLVSVVFFVSNVFFGARAIILQMRLKTTHCFIPGHWPLKRNFISCFRFCYYSCIINLFV